MSNSVRVRFAPSPTGHLHIGGLRTALFNWLFARHHKGKFLVRVEDTDIERSRIEYVESQLDALAWCGLRSDEPIIFQSQRSVEYHAVAERLVTTGAAYRCYCTPEEVQNRVGSNISIGGDGYSFYDGHCRRPCHTVLEKPFVIRMRVPRERKIMYVHDLIHGTLEFPLHVIDDFIIVRSTGAPMYNFTVVVDDAYMGITHVIRGDEHLINTPKQLLIYEAAQFAVPQFAHLPLILGSDGRKLSKRDAATAVHDYRNEGILADALNNYLVRLGWSHGNQEIFTQEELIALFSLGQVGVKAAVFDAEKLLWLNSMYIKSYPPDVLYRYIMSDIDPLFRTALTHWSDVQVFALIRLYQGRCRSLRELAAAVSGLAHDPPLHDKAVIMKGQVITEALLETFKGINTWNAQALKESMQAYAQQQGMSFADVAMPVRYALTGATQAPAVGELLEVLGPEVSLRRLRTILSPS